jgi:hypothetical protein
MNVVTDRNLDRWRPDRQLTIFPRDDDLCKTGGLRHRLAPTVNLVGVNICTARNIGNRRTGRKRRQHNSPLLLIAPSATTLNTRNQLRPLHPAPSLVPVIKPVFAPVLV